MVMQVILNGKPKTLEGQATVAELLQWLKRDPLLVAVEINEDIVPRSAYDGTRLSEGDQIEIVTFVGGGSCQPIGIV